MSGSMHAMCASAHVFDTPCMTIKACILYDIAKQQAALADVVFGAHARWAWHQAAHTCCRGRSGARICACTCSGSNEEEGQICA